MKMYNINQTAMDSSVPKYLAIAMDKAYNTSDRAGIAWVLTHSNKITVLHGGFSGNIDVNDFREYQRLDEESELFLSCPPYPLFVNFTDLKKIVRDLNITKINFPKLSRELSEALEVSKIDHIDNCETKVHNVRQISEKIYCGPISLLKRKRPWTRCLIGSTMSGHSLPLEHFFSEFGVKSYILEKFAQSTSIGFESGYQLSTADLNTNAATFAIPQYQVSNIQDIQNVHGQLKLLNSPVLTMVCSFELFSQLMSTDLVDECICHVSMLNQPSEHNQHSYLLPNVELDEWEITESVALTKGVRIHFNRSRLTKELVNCH
jgi:hypothetical protein